MGGKVVKYSIMCDYVLFIPETLIGRELNKTLLYILFDKNKTETNIKKKSIIWLSD